MQVDNDKKTRWVRDDPGERITDIAGSAVANLERCVIDHSAILITLQLSLLCGNTNDCGGERK